MFEELGLCDTNTGLILFRLVHAESIHVLQRAQVGYGSTCNSQPSGCSVVLCIHISNMSVIDSLYVTTMYIFPFKVCMVEGIYDYIVASFWTDLF